MDSHSWIDKLKKISTNVLVGFVFISIGFALGKNSVRNEGPSPIHPSYQGIQGDYIAVYYMHSTFRCVSCNTIEKMTQSLLNLYYKEELADGRIRWQEVDFQEDETLAKQFEVIASCVVVARVEGGVVTHFKRLDEVWTLMKKPVLFNKTISNAIDLYLQDRVANK